MNKGVNESGELQRIKQHGMSECEEMCCGVFLDRRYLQYEGGLCECGVLVMEKLGIRPATEKEHRWRRALYEQDCSQLRKDEVRQVLNPLLDKMGIN